MLPLQEGAKQMQRQTVLVTGSSKGIGAAISKRFAREGYHAFITYHDDESAGRAVVAAIEYAGGQATLVSLDVRSEQSVRDVFAQVEREVGHLNVLVSSAVIDVAKNL